MPVLLALAIGLFLVISAAPSPPGLSADELSRRFDGLPVLFNFDPADRPRTVRSSVATLEHLEGGDRTRAVTRLVDIGAAGLPDVVAAMETLPAGPRARIARELAPVALRMGLDGLADLDDPIKAEDFWQNVLSQRGADLTPAAVRRALRRHLAERSEPLYARQLSDADTAALVPLMEALDTTLSAPDRDEVQTLATVAAMRVGATDVTDLDSLRAWWSVHRADYVEFDPLERIAAHITETRFGRWVITALAHRFGRSWRTDAPVLADLAQHAAPTLLRTLLALLLAYAAALPIAALGARRAGKMIDGAAAGVTLLLYAVPAFVLALIGRALLPRAATNVVLVVAVALASLAPLTRQARASFLEVLSQDYIRSARAKGVGERSIWLRHVLRNALGPIVGLAALQVPVALTTSLVAEEVLSVDGLGPSAMAAIRAHDIPWLMAFTLSVAIGTLLVLVTSDVVQATLDPRVREALAGVHEDG